MKPESKQEGKYMCSECDTLYDSINAGCPRCNKKTEPSKQEVNAVVGYENTVAIAKKIWDDIDRRETDWASWYYGFWKGLQYREKNPIPTEIKQEQEQGGISKRLKDWIEQKDTDELIKEFEEMGYRFVELSTPLPTSQTGVLSKEGMLR